MALKTHKLGSSDLEVPILCMGTMTFGEQNTEEEAYELLDYCMTRGVNFIDTAELYPVPPNKEKAGQSELMIGRWMASRNCRDKVILATKIHGASNGLDRSYIVANRQEPPLNDGTQPNLSAAQIREACDASLRRLQTSYIDLYQIHWPERYSPLWGARQYDPTKEKSAVVSIEEQVQAMGELLKEGKIRHWGLSNESTMGTVHFCEAAKKLGVALPISMQNDFSLVFRHFEEELAEACAPSNYNIGLLAYGPLAGGTLTGKYHDGHTSLEKARHTIFAAFQARYHSERTMAATAEYVALAKRKGLTPTQLALAWCKSRWFMGSIIIGATTMQQLKENIDACETDLDEATLREIDEVHVRMRNPNAIN